MPLFRMWYVPRISSAGELIAPTYVRAPDALEARLLARDFHGAKSLEEIAQAHELSETYVAAMQISESTKSSN